MINVLTHMSDIMIPMVIFWIVGYGMVSGVKVYETFLKTEELNKMLIDVLVKKITVAENAKIEITFQFEDEMRMLYERLKESCSA